MSCLREEEATHHLLQRLEAPPLSDARYEEIVGEWRGKPPPGVVALSAAFPSTYRTLR